MSDLDPHPVPSFGPSRDAALWDKICGGISAVAGLCSITAGIFASLVMGVMFGGLSALNTNGQPQAQPNALPFAGVSAALLMGIFIGIAALQFLIGFGMWNSRKWAFILAIPIYALCGLSSAKSAVGAVVGIGIVVYSILRLAGSIGPKPD